MKSDINSGNTNNYTRQAPTAGTKIRSGWGEGREREESHITHEEGGDGDWRPRVKEGVWARDVTNLVLASPHQYTP